MLDDTGPLFTSLMWSKKPVYILAGTAFLAYTLLSALTILQMLIGVLCEVIAAVAYIERETLMVDKVHEKFGKVLNKLDEDNDGDLTWEEFCQIFSDDDVRTEALDALDSVNVDPEGLVDVATDIFFDHGEPVKVSFEEFMGMVLDLRGGQEATVKDIMGLGKHFNRNMMKTKAEMNSLDAQIDTVLSKMSVLLEDEHGDGKKEEDFYEHVAGKLQEVEETKAETTETESAKTEAEAAAKAAEEAEAGEAKAEAAEAEEAAEQKQGLRDPALA
jgi:hypothetical protein